MSSIENSKERGNKTKQNKRTNTHIQLTNLVEFTEFEAKMNVFRISKMLLLGFRKRASVSTIYKHV